MVISTGLGASPKARLTFGIWHSESQELLKASGMDWTLVQPTYFMQNLLWQADSIAKDGVYLDDLGGPVSWVDARDIADVAAEALTGEGHEGKAYGLTGAEALDGARLPGLTVALSGLTLFGGRWPAVLAVGATGAGLAPLHAKVMRIAREAGVDLRRERFRPHVTIARFPREMGPKEQARLGEFLALNGTFALPPEPALSVSLCRSHLTQDGAQYEPLASFPLNG